VAENKKNRKIREDRALALFDFDGTLTKIDSLPDFIKFAVGKKSYYFGLLLLSPILVLYKLKVIPNDAAKERLLGYFFQGWDNHTFQELADNYSLQQLNNIIRPEAMKRLIWHQKQGHKVVIVSASMECWLRGWCNKNKIELIATVLEVSQGKLTGRFASKNCNGLEKVYRVQLALDLSLYGCIYVYGDSQGDQDMLGLADKAYYRSFK